MLNYPNIDPVAFTLGPLKIHWYGISYVVSVSLAWYCLRRRALSMNWSLVHIDDLIFYATIGIIIGGRLGSVLFYNLPQYLQHPLDIFKLWQGGMSFHGGLIGVSLAIIYHAHKTGKRFFEISDFLAPVVPIGLGFGRIANFINGELWGAPSQLPWAMIFPNAGGIPRHPSQLYEALLEGLVLFIILWVYSSKPRPAMAVTGLFMLGYGIFRSGIELIREPDQHIGYLAFNWLTMGQLLSLPMILIGIFLLYFAHKSKQA